MVYPLSSNLKFLRKKKGLTQESLAEILGISRPKLAGYELSINPPLETLVKFSDQLGVSTDILLREDLSS